MLIGNSNVINLSSRPCRPRNRDVGAYILDSKKTSSRRTLKRGCFNTGHIRILYRVSVDVSGKTSSKIFVRHSARSRIAAQRSQINL